MRVQVFLCNIKLLRQINPRFIEYRKSDIIGIDKLSICWYIRLIFDVFGIAKIEVGKKRGSIDLSAGTVYSIKKLENRY